jgi:hypothetical protein
MLRFFKALDLERNCCRPCENGGGLKLASGLMVGMTGVRHFPPKLASDLT